MKINQSKLTFLKVSNPCDLISKTIHAIISIFYFSIYSAAFVSKWKPKSFVVQTWTHNSPNTVILCVLVRAILMEKCADV